MPKGIQKLKITFGESNLTHFGGIFLIHLFCKKLRIRWLLQKCIYFPPRQGNRYHSADLVLSILYIIISGIERVQRSRILQYNGSFQNIVGLKSFPKPGTLRNFLKKLTTKTLKSIVRLHDSFRIKMILLPYPLTSLIFDMDSTIITVYGKLEGAKIGYNPHKPGRASYRPFVCFEAHTLDCWHECFRSGGEPTGEERKKFVLECLQKIPPGIYRIRIRADSKFCTHHVVELLDERQIGYAIVSSITSAFKKIIPGLSYRTFKKGWEAAEFKYQPYRWKKSHRFIVVRRLIPEKAEKQLTLFTLKNYAYHIILTNLPLKPEEVWYFYCGRANVESYIKELKNDYSLSRIPTRLFLSNQIYFHLLTFAYNIVNWFKRLCLPKELQKKTMNTLRTDFLVLPAKLVKIDNRNILKLPKNYIYQNAFQYALHKLGKGSFSQIFTNLRKVSKSGSSGEP